MHLRGLHKGWERARYGSLKDYRISEVPGPIT